MRQHPLTIDDGLNVKSAQIAEMLSGAWRTVPPPPGTSAEEFKEVAPYLSGTGAGALGWWKVRGSGLRHTAAARSLLQTYRRYSVANMSAEQGIRASFIRLRSVGVEPILIKGWAVARHYPEAGLRPYGDVDLCVPTEQLNLAREALGDLKEKWLIDLHAGLGKSDESTLDELHSRSRLVTLGGVNVRVPCPEDHLRVLCVHLLKHNFHRPLWLCDIAAVVETLPQMFDWDICLGKNLKRAGWVLSTIRLAQELLGASPSVELPAGAKKRLPGWFVRNVLGQWGTYPEWHRAPMRDYLRRPAGMIKDLRRRWPDPTGATVRLGGSINRMPRLPYQLGDCLLRTAKFATQLPSLLRTHTPPADAPPTA